ncbi:MAG: GntR family transcriptional regulator, partial [Candidatus Dadabacteria bacterium]|nr:GntR family transcriptional regulator [Candidatus Dadabacteria bacterium]
MSLTTDTLDDRKQYEKVADHIRSLVHSGVLKPGDRIPSVRRMSLQQGVSITTVLEAYHRLEDSHFIRARPQSGYFVRAQAVEAAPELKNHCPPDCRRSEVTVSDRIVEVYTEASNSEFVQFGAAALHPNLLPLKSLSRSEERRVGKE